MERVACYIRVSTEEQKLHGISLDAQKDKLSEYAKAHKLTIVGWYEDEGVSGRKLIKKRPALQRMLNDAHNKQFDRIIFIKLDRFFRSVAEYHECMKYIEPVVWTATEEKYDLSTASGRAFVNMKLTIAELEADQTGERIKIVNDYKIKSGRPLTGSRCLGIAYTVQVIDGVKRVVIDENNRAMVLDAINHYITYQNKCSLARYLQTKYNFYQHNSIDTLLTDTKLYGYYRGNDNYCEALIDKATFDKIQDILKNNHVKKAPSSRTYLFCGVIICPKCGKRLSGSSNNANYHKYYRCNNSALYKCCDYKLYVPELAIESELLERFDAFVTNYVKVKSIEAIATTTPNTERVKELNNQLKNLTTVFIKGRITEPEYNKLYNQLENELQALERLIQPVEQQDLTIYNNIINGGWKSLYNALNAENKRAFWRKYIKQIHINPDKTIKDIIFL